MEIKQETTTATPEKEYITKKLASQEVRKVLEMNKKTSMYGTIGLILVLVSSITAPPFVVTLIAFPCILFCGYMFMISKKRDEELKMKYGE